jgi:hypothetical protein
LPVKLKRSPRGVDHSPVITASCSSSRSNRSRSGGKPMPNDWCSRWYHPVPMPSSTRPPLIWSTVAAMMASDPGCRKVPAVISVPSRILLVWTARPASVVQESVGR